MLNRLFSLVQISEENTFVILWNIITAELGSTMDKFFILWELTSHRLQSSFFYIHKLSIVFY